MLSLERNQERLDRAIRLNEIRLDRKLSVSTFSRVIGGSYPNVYRACSKHGGMTNKLFELACSKLKLEESYYLRFGKKPGQPTKDEEKKKEFVKVETKITQYIVEGYTEDEAEIIKILRTMPKLKAKILNNLQLKARLKFKHEDFMKA